MVMTRRAQAVKPATRRIRAFVDFLLVVLPAFLLLNLLENVVRTVGPGWRTEPWVPLDFRSFWRDGRHYLHGHSPYHAAFAHTSVYPAPVAALFAPLAMVPFHVAVGIHRNYLGIWHSSMRGVADGATNRTRKRLPPRRSGEQRKGQ